MCRDAALPVMTKIQFRFAWHDDEKRVMAYTAEGDWNWRDYHACARASIFSMHRHPHKVDTLIDLREGTRVGLPAGAAAHVAVFGKILTPALSGRAVVIGISPEEVARLGAANGVLTTRDGYVRFVQDEDDLQSVLDAWRRESA